MKNILIIGAGAVGQVYGLHFVNAGMNVTFFVKPKYTESIKSGITLYNLGKDATKQSPIMCNDYQVADDWNDVANTQWDQVYFCISSTAMRHVDFDPIKNVLSDNTIFVVLQSGPDDVDYVKERIPEKHIVQGMISMISYQCPMPKEYAPQPGIAYWLPWVAPTPFAGNPAHCRTLVSTFREAKMRAKVDQNLTLAAPYPNAALMQFLSALQICDWKFSKLSSNGALRHKTAKAIKQSFQAIAAEYGSKVPFWHKVVTGRVLQVGLGIAPKIMPLDLETYLEFHFMKVNDQTQLYMQTYTDLAKKHNIRCNELEWLNETAHG